MPRDGFADDLTQQLLDWRHQRDQEHGERWGEYYRAWRGMWDPSDKNRESERSRVIMPTTSQAIESAVAEVEESLFQREQWLSTGEPRLDDLLMADLWRERAALSEAFILGSIYGTVALKLLVTERDRIPQVDLQALSVDELIVDPSATSLAECHGVAHEMWLPRVVVERRMRDGLYESLALEGSSDPMPRHRHENQPRQTDYIHILEYHGLVPIEELEARQRTAEVEDSAIGDDGLVEAICVIANEEFILRCEPNPFGDDRPFVVAQWQTVPRRIWGRGTAEQAYWPQKALDAEVRARIDALAFSVAPMMAVSANQVPRAERFEVRPGRNIFMRGDVRTGMMPVQFPPPDPQTYTQSLEMQRMAELATGQLQQTNPLSGDMSRTAAAPLMGMLSATVKRSRRTLENIERNLIVPLIEKIAVRMNALDPQVYPRLAQKPKILSGNGLIAREFENQQLANLMQSLPEGAAQLSLLRLIVEGTAHHDKERVLGIIDQMVERLSNPPPEGLSPADEVALARMQQDAELAQGRLQLDTARLRLEQQRSEAEHQRSVLELSLRAIELEQKEVATNSAAILNVARAEAEELGAQLEQYRAIVDTMITQSRTAEVLNE